MSPRFFRLQTGPTVAPEYATATSPAPRKDERRGPIITVVELTRVGRNAVKPARRVIDAGLKEIWSAHLTDEESTVLIEVMDRVLEANHDCC